MENTLELFTPSSEIGTLHEGESKNCQYRSRFTTWETDRSCRKGPYELFAEEEELGMGFFPENLMPFLACPLVQDRGSAAKRFLQIQAIHNYMFFTEILETEVVNPISLEISKNKLGILIPDQMQGDAWRIYADEAAHGQSSDDTSRQIRISTGVHRLTTKAPRFQRKLNRCLAHLPGYLRQPVRLFFVIVSETLISANLNQIPSDKNVVSLIRNVVKAHAADEARHHSFFSQVLERVWPSLTQEQQSIIGPLLPEFIKWFLEPDKEAIFTSLQGLHFSRSQINDILDWAYPDSKVLANVAAAGRYSVVQFKRCGVLLEPLTNEAFYNSGLIS